MATSLTTAAVEKSTFVVIATFTDEDGDLIQPKTLKWTLTNSQGTVINSRENVEVSSPSSEQNIVLSGKDLKMESQSSLKEDRYLIVQGTYDSTYGTDLPLKASCWFKVTNLKAVS